MQTDEQILAQRCRNGDSAARKELYESYAGGLFAICLRYIGTRDIAEDVLHDAFLKIYGSFDKFTYRGKGSLKAWMSRVTVNLALEWLRTNKRKESIELKEERTIDIADEPSADAAARIPHEVVMRFVSELAEGYRTVFNLYCIEEYSHREIAEMLGINEKSSASQLFRAKAILARKINDYLKR